MSVFKKIKDVLFDIEEDEDTSVSRETTTKVVKEKNPIKEVKMPVEENHDDEIVSEIPKRNNSFNFPLDFDDDLPSRSDKNNIESKKSTYNNKVNNDLFDDDFDVPRRNREDYIVKETDYNKKEQPRDYSKFLQPKKEEKKIFRPSPVISPVYGVLNQNYTKDDVIVKTDTGVKSPTLEDVRKKAYEKQKEEENKKVDDEFAEPLKTLDEILINNQNIKEEPKVDEENKTLEETPMEKEEKKVKVEKKIEVKEEEKVNVSDDDKSEDDTLEKDLFNLIDSMYENKDEEEEE